MSMFKHRFLTGLALVALAGCADSQELDPAGLRVVGISSSDLVVGQSFEVFVRDVDSPTQANVSLRFQGQYTTDDGQVDAVDLPLASVYDGEGFHYDDPVTVFRISRLGPFSNPFTSSDRPGRFEGHLHITVQAPDGTMMEGANPMPVSIDVGPSVIIEEFQPVDADCGAPAVRAFAGLAYRLGVRGVGIKPVRFTYQLNGINDSNGPMEIVHTFDNPIERDVLGVDEAILFNAIPADKQSAIASIRVIIEDAEGRTVETALPISIHRPIDVTNSGRRILAQRYEPVPASGCMPGTLGGSVTYSEARTEYRQQSVNVTFRGEWTSSRGNTASETWSEGIREGTSQSRTLGGSEREDERLRESHGLRYGSSESNDMSYRSSDGQTWNWSRREGESNTDYEDRLNRLYGEGNWSGTVGAEASGSVPGFAKVTGRTSVTTGVRAGGSVGETNGLSRTTSSDRGYGMSGTSSESRGFGSTLTEDRSEDVSGAYTLSRSAATDHSDRNTRTESQTWDFSQGATSSNLVSNGLSESESRTWSTSSSDTTVTSFSGALPIAKFGVFYRQTTRWVRRAEMRGFDQCGVAEHIGEIQFNEWTWAPDLATADSCDQVPMPNFEPAECFIEPCN